MREIGEQTSEHIDEQLDEHCHCRGFLDGFMKRDDERVATSLTPSPPLHQVGAPSACQVSHDEPSCVSPGCSHLVISPIQPLSMRSCLVCFPLISKSRSAATCRLHSSLTIHRHPSLSPQVPLPTATHIHPSLGTSISSPSPVNLLLDSQPLLDELLLVCGGGCEVPAGELGLDPGDDLQSPAAVAVTAIRRQSTSMHRTLSHTHTHLHAHKQTHTYTHK